METTRTPILGIDIGRVIIDGSHHPSGSDTAFFRGGEAELLATPAMPDAFEAIAELTVRFDGNVWLVSKCGPRVQERSLRWLEHHGFWPTTGMKRNRVRFCRQRPEKADICRDLGITHFIDDRRDVLSAMRGTVPHRYLFGPQQGRPPGDLVWVKTWSHALLELGQQFR